MATECPGAGTGFVGRKIIQKLWDSGGIVVKMKSPRKLLTTIMDVFSLFVKIGFTGGRTRKATNTTP